MPIIDFHIHYTPESMVRAQLGDSAGPVVRYKDGIPAYTHHEGLFRLDRHIEVMDAAGVEYATLSSGAAMDADLETAVIVNDALAQDISGFGGRLIGLAHAPAAEAAGVTELHRVADRYGFPGAALATTVAGRYLDHADFDPFYAALSERGMFLFIHPALNAPDYAPTVYDAYDLYRCIGREHELIAATMRLIWGGAFDRHPELKVVMSHLGGGLSAILDRIRGYEDRLHMGVSDNPTHARLPKHPIEHYFEENLLFDTGGVFGSVNAVKSALLEIPAESIVFGSDYPQEIRSTRDYAQFMQRLRESDIDPGVVEKILSTNGSRLGVLGGLAASQ